MVEKMDIAAMRKTLVEEYRNYPNPTNDMVLAFEARAAEIIAELTIMALVENNERQTPPADLLQCYAAMFAGQIKNILDHIKDEHGAEIASRYGQHFMGCFFHYLHPGSAVSTGEHEIPMREVGDA